MRENSIIKSFDYKWYQFLIIYGIINLFFFYCCFNTGLSEMFPEWLHDDAGGLSAVLELFILPFQMIFLIITIGILFVFEFVSILIFGLTYSKSEVEAEERVQLSHNIRNAIVFFLLAYLICIPLFGDIRDIVYFVLLYLPIPSFTFLLIYLKITSNKGESNNGESAKKKINWVTLVTILAIIIGLYFCVNIVLTVYSFLSV